MFVSSNCSGSGPELLTAGCDVIASSVLTYSDIIYSIDSIFSVWSTCVIMSLFGVWDQ